MYRHMYRAEGSVSVMVYVSVFFCFFSFLIFLNNSAYIPFFKENQEKQIFFVTESKNRGDPSALFCIHIYNTGSIKLH